MLQHERYAKSLQQVQHVLSMAATQLGGVHVSHNVLALQLSASFPAWCVSSNV
jgi:hypothetical protein